MFYLTLYYDAQKHKIKTIFLLLNEIYKYFGTNMQLLYSERFLQINILWQALINIHSIFNSYNIITFSHTVHNAVCVNLL